MSNTVPRWLASSGTSGSNVEKRNVAVSKTQCALSVSSGLARCRWSRRNTWNAGNKGSCVAESCVNVESFAQLNSAFPLYHYQEVFLNSTAIFFLPSFNFEIANCKILIKIVHLFACFRNSVK